MSLTKRWFIQVQGSVQGVGFRPFVFRLANQYQLVGTIRNTSQGVDIDVQGEAQSLIDFQKDIVAKKPERAVILEIRIQDLELHDATQLEIVSSESGSETTLALLPDTAICPLCMQELMDPNNRRYRYPFLHCMTCGPRFSIFLRMPFDRAHTTMVDFKMCEDCQKEYCDPSDRRFYSQTNCCPKCGPKLTLLDPYQNPLASTNCIEETVHLLKDGKIVAVKNTGGFLLLVDATNEEAVERLRTRKNRKKKPFALLVPNLGFAKNIAEVSLRAEEVLTSPAAPIVLLKKKNENLIAPTVVCESPYYGIMLPHNALQYLIMMALDRPIVATSGNISGQFLCITEEEAFEQLFNVADAFLIHNRRIHHRMDDSIVQIIKDEPTILRRARGYVPSLISIPDHLQPNSWMIGSGGHLKNSFAFAKERRMYLSQYIGDLESNESCQKYEQEIASWELLLNMNSSKGVTDFHSDYNSTRFIQKRQIPMGRIQHHRAHVYAGMADQQLTPPLLAFSWDGTGLGDDQTIWGSEAFLVTDQGAEHFASLLPFRLPGSAKAIREPRRSALGLLHALFGSNIVFPAFTEEETKVLISSLEKKVQAPICSSMGRLFDGVSSLLDCCQINDYEGHAAIVLEALVGNQGPNYSIHLNKKETIWQMDWRELIQRIIEDKKRGVDVAEIAFGFHQSLAKVIVALAQKASLPTVLLTGGVMQNKVLLEMSIDGLKQAGFKPYWHHQIPPNDSGLAVGQLMGQFYVSCCTR